MWLWGKRPNRSRTLEISQLGGCPCYWALRRGATAKTREPMTWPPCEGRNHVSRMRSFWGCLTLSVYLPRQSVRKKRRDHSRQTNHAGLNRLHGGSELRQDRRGFELLPCFLRVIMTRALAPNNMSIGPNARLLVRQCSRPTLPAQGRCCTRRSRPGPPQVRHAAHDERFASG